MRMMLDLGPDDVGLRLHAAVPLQRPDGGLGAVDRGRLRRWRWPGGSAASGWLPDVRRYGATCFNYTGKPLSYLRGHSRAAPTTPTTRCGWRSATRAHPRCVDAFGRRFGVEVIDAFGSTEGGIAVNRDAAAARRAPGPGRRHHPGRRRGRATTCPPARFDADGRLAQRRGVRRRDRQHRRRRAVRGLLQQPRGHRSGHRATAGTGAATSATSTPTATSTSPAAPPTGSGSTARTSPPGRSRRRSAAHPDVVVAAVYGVPDVARRRPGDGRAGAARRAPRSTRRRSPAGSTTGRGLGPKWRPRYVRVATALPTTGTNKVVKRTLRHQKCRRDRVRRRRAVGPRPGRRRLPARSPPTTRPRCAPRSGAAGRDRFWDL